MRGMHLVLLLLLLSCSSNYKYENAVSLSLHDFSSSENLHGTLLEFDTPVMRPTDILVKDTLLMTIDLSEDKLIHVYNLNSKKKISQCIDRGQGPNDMIMPRFINSQDSVINMVDIATSTIYTFKITDLSEPDVPVKAMSRIKINEMINMNVEILNDNILCNTFTEDYQIGLFNFKGDKVNEIIRFPVSGIEYSNIEKMDAYNMNFVVNQNKRKIAVFYYMTDLFEIYDEQGLLLERVHGPDKFFPHFKEHRDGEVSYATPKKGINRDAYFSPQNAGRQMMVLYNGGYVDDPNHTSSCKTIFSFDWDGKPISMLRLNDPVFRFTVDSRVRKIYGISNTPEYHIVEYSF